MAESSPKPPSAREALRRLSRRHPAPAELEKILNDLMSAPDMSVAIVSAALVEAMLEKLLQSRFVSSDPNLIGRIFNNRGPMSDFDSKILIAHAFGFITDDIAADLHSLQAIRNAFAHAKVQISFDHDIIGREIASLKMRDEILGSLEDKRQAISLDNRGLYAIVARILIRIIDKITEKIRLS
jgi:DNA-binding MltR family transcriptional regulator